MAGSCLLILSLGMREHGRGDYRVIGRGLIYGSGAQCFVCPAAHRVAPTIPNDYSSTTTIPKLNFRVPERTVTMQDADRCREGDRWEEN